jgi:hypothetical protein
LPHNGRIADCQSPNTRGHTNLRGRPQGRATEHDSATAFPGLERRTPESCIYPAARHHTRISSQRPGGRDAANSWISRPGHRSATGIDSLAQEISRIRQANTVFAKEITDVLGPHLFAPSSSDVFALTPLVRQAKTSSRGQRDQSPSRLSKWLPTALSVNLDRWLMRNQRTPPYPRVRRSCISSPPAHLKGDKPISVDSGLFSGTTRQESCGPPVKTVCHPRLTSLRCPKAGYFSAS